MSRPTPPETLAWLRHAAAGGKADARLLLNLVERLEALEQRPIPGTVELAAPTPEAAPIATDEELWDLWNAEGMNFIEEVLRACYNLGREHGAPAAARCPHIRTGDEGTSYCALAEQTAAAPPAPSPPAGGLVERLVAAGYGRSRARAAIREVAEWLREQGVPG